METSTEAPPQRPAPEGARRPAACGTPRFRPAKRRRPPIAVIVIGAILVIAALIWGVRYLAYASTHQTTDDARVDADTVTVTSKIQERVAQILVDTNQPVHKGQIIVRLDDTDERAAVQQAQAALTAQRANARAAQENVDLTRATVAAQATQGAGGITAAQQRHSERVGASAVRTTAGRRGALGDRTGASPAPRRAGASSGGACGAVRARTRTSRATRRSCAPATSRRRQLDAQRAAQAQAQSQYQSAIDNVSAAQTGVAQAQARYTSAVAAATAAVRRHRRAARSARDGARPADRERQPVPRVGDAGASRTRRPRRPARSKRRSKRRKTGSAIR